MTLIYNIFRCSSRFKNVCGGNRILSFGVLKGCHNPKNIRNEFSSQARCFAAVACDSLSEKSVKTFLDYATNVYEGKEKDKSEIIEILETPEVGILVQERIKILENIKSLEELMKNDKEMKHLAEEEFTSYLKSLKDLEERLLDTISACLGQDFCSDVVLEVNAGVGGQEAMLFAGDLLEMYQNHVEFLGYDSFMMEKDVTDIGGIRHASLTISGRGVYERLRHEAGVHRVQRIPVTETSGRVHTSVVSVVIFPQPSDIEINLQEKDLRIDTFRSSGAGGQSVNKMESAVRITHVPTGIVAESQKERSQIRNKSIALIKLRTRIFETRLKEQEKSTRATRKKQMGLKNRNERIRTYNFLQDRITDHRIQNGTMHGLSEFMKGGSSLNELQERLQKDFERKVLLETISESEGKK